MFEFLKKKKKPGNLKEVISEIEILRGEIEKILKEIEVLKKENIFNVKKVGIVRFNPFKEVGGNQSFSVALLDGKDDGVVITSLYSREGNRVFGKPIKDGKSEYILLEEEKQAINLAQHGEKSKSNNKTTGSGNFRPH